MKRIIITANPESIRAFRLGTKFVKDRFEFYLTEIEFPEEPETLEKDLDIDARFHKMVKRIHGLITSEKPESWVMTAPLSTLTRLLAALEPSATKRLVETRIDDLTALPTSRLTRRFTPSQIAA